MRKTVRYIIIVLVLVSLVYYFWTIIDRAAGKKETRQNLLLWIAPDERMEKFWKIVVDEWNDKEKGMKVDFRNIPSSGSSEEAIFTSIASRTSPDICTGIVSGFSKQLISLDAVHNLQSFDGYEELIKQRKMAVLIKRWAVDAESYVFPVFSSPLLVWWRWDILSKLGWKDVPMTYSDIFKLSEQVCIPRKRYCLKIFGSNDWWSRWNDFIAYYYAASGGKPYIENNKAVFDNNAGKDVMKFFKTMLEKKYTLYIIPGLYPFYDGTLAGMATFANEVEIAKQTFPKMLKNIKVGTLPVPDDYKGKKYTRANTRGLVVFKMSKYPEEAWNFIKWVFSQDKFSLLWLECTGFPPVRGDLMTNPIFDDFYKNNRISYEYAKYMDTAIPPASIVETIAVQDAMTNKLIEPMVYGKKSIETLLKNTVEQVNQDLSATHH